MSTWYELSKIADGQWQNVGLSEAQDDYRIKEKIIDMYNKGIPIIQISRQLGVGLHAVEALVPKDSPQSKRVISPRKELTPENLNQAVQMFRQGKTVNEIATHFNISHQALLPLLLKSLNPDERTNYRIKVLERKSPQDIPKIINVLKLKIENQGLTYSQISNQTGIDPMLQKELWKFSIQATTKTLLCYKKWNR